MKKGIIVSLLVVPMIMSVFTFVQAQTSTDFGLGYVGSSKTGLKDVDPRIMIANVIRWALGFLGIIATIIILIGGFKWMTSGGSDEGANEGKKWLINGVIGLALVMASYGIASFAINSINSSIVN